GDRLGQEIDGAGLHGLHADRDRSLAGQEDDRPLAAELRTLAPQLDPRQAGHGYVEHGAARNGGVMLSQEGLGGGKAVDLQPGGPKQACEAGQHGRVVVHEEDPAAGRAHRPASRAVGRVIQKLAPRPALFVAQRWPPWAWTMVRHTASPSPSPPPFEVTKGWKILSSISSAMPIPLSV